jgi:TatD DNase family protein
VVDSHCHLADPAFAEDLPDVVARARAAGLTSALCILSADEPDEVARHATVRAAWPEVRFAAGVHPHRAGRTPGEAAGAVAATREAMARVDGAAVGEIGLDYHYDFSPRDVQHAVFRAQVRLARELQRPVVIHTREADEDTIAILREDGGGEVRGVLHCFTGDDALADAGLALGLFVSLAGIVTFPKAEPLRQTARRVPLDRLLIETDSPFLSPMPYRGTRNEPAYVARVAATLAELHQMAPADMAARTRANFHTLFRP